MNAWIRNIGLAIAGAMALGIGVWLYNGFVTPLDRPWFLSDKEETLVVTYVAWGCNCANYVEASGPENPVTEHDDDDYFFIEPSRPDLTLGGDYFVKNKFVRLTGRFFLDKGISTDFRLGHCEDKPDHARVFWVEKIEHMPGNNK